MFWSLVGYQLVRPHRTAPGCDIYNGGIRPSPPRCDFPVPHRSKEGCTVLSRIPLFSLSGILFSFPAQVARYLLSLRCIRLAGVPLFSSLPPLSSRLFLCPPGRLTTRGRVASFSRSIGIRAGLLQEMQTMAMSWAEVSASVTVQICKCPVPVCAQRVLLIFGVGFTRLPSRWETLPLL